MKILPTFPYAVITLYPHKYRSCVLPVHVPEHDIFIMTRNVRKCFVFSASNKFTFVLLLLLFWLLNAGCGLGLC